MTDKEYKLIIGGLLHDIGKVIYRTGDGRKHSKSGYDYLKEEVDIDDSIILESVLYHHADAIKNANIADNSCAYITYIADNIASATDRRKKENEDYGFEVTQPLQPVFNILNGNNADMYYHPSELTDKINYPTDEMVPFNSSFYIKIKHDISDCIKGIELSSPYVNSLLSILESTLTYVPSSTSKSEVADISLYDHLKLTAAINSCLLQYLEYNNINNYREELFVNAKEFYNKDTFLLYSMDISGIQSFIYTIQSQNALKTLRARSYYLEIMMEHIIDCLLEKVNLSRANLIYVGGGHCYMLLPNTQDIINTLEEYEKDLNNWFMDNFDVDLYIATAYVKANANTLQNIPEDSYSQLFRDISAKLSDKKLNRYTATEIINLNNIRHKDNTRECKTCKRCVQVNEDNICDFCANLIEFSKGILHKKFYVVVNEKEKNSLPLPNNSYILLENEDELKKRIKKNENSEEKSYIRAYGINEAFTGKNIATKIHVGNYSKGQTFDDLAKSSEGIDRIGILRADVDNLGYALTQGFSENYNTLSRTATLSRHLSLFFKYYINYLLKNKKYSFSNSDVERNATIVYSGGDDVFIVGAWNEIIEIAVDLRESFKKYTQNTLSISAGIGIYKVGYPISQIALEVGSLEEMSKDVDGKAAITLIPDIEVYYDDKLKERTIKTVYGTYKWDVFINDVINEKLYEVKRFFDSSDERGKNFLYNLIELIRNREEKINFARYVYVLARMEPGKESSPEKQELYKEFSNNMYKWIQNADDCNQLKTAMNIYAYLQRETNKEEGVNE